MKKEPFDPIPKDLDGLASRVVESAFRVHRALGPGLLESVYEACLCYELSKQGIRFERQIDRPVEYEGVNLGAGLCIDILVDRSIVLELKSVERVAPVHKAQLLTYMKLTGSRLGFLINFNEAHLKDGIIRMVL